MSTFHNVFGLIGAFALGVCALAIVLRALRSHRIGMLPNVRDALSIVARSPDALMRFDSDLRCIFASPAAERLFGRSAAVLANRPLGGSLATDARAAVEAAAMHAREGWEGAEAVFRTATGMGDARWIEARLTCTLDDGGFVAVLRDVSKRKTAELALRVANAELNRLAGSDGLTELANRRRFEQMLESTCRRASRQGSPGSLLLINIDGFDAFTRLYGHQSGDACLKRVAGAIRNALRGPADVAARFAGEEFAVMLPGCNEEAALNFADRLLAAVMALGIAHAANPDRGIATASAGCATAETGRDGMPASGALLIAEAERALYGCKQAGRNRVTAAGVPCAGPPGIHPAAA